MKDGHVTKIEDLMVICANCYKKVHGLKITVDKLIEINKRIETSTNTSKGNKNGRCNWNSNCINT